MKEIPDAHLLLVGDGGERARFKAQAAHLGISDRCHFVGRIPPERLADTYRAMDVFAFPSTSAAEAFGLVAVEAMACAIPVVASNLPGVRSVVSDAGILVPPGDAPALAAALRRVLADAPLRQQLSATGRTRATSRFSWDRHVDGLIDAYQSIVKEPSVR
jgi:glycosyltransferase involved in cell wall biosynthesis